MGMMMTIDRKEPGFGFGSFLLGSGSLSHSLMRTPRIPREVIGMETRLQRGSKRNVQMNKHFTVTKLYYILYYTILTAFLVRPLQEGHGCITSNNNNNNK